MHIDKLISIGSAAIAPAVGVNAFPINGDGQNERRHELEAMLSTKNGFYAFEAALHVFPQVDSPSCEGCMGVQAWNESGLWRDWYLDSAKDLYFFAEDVFGVQFAIRGNEVVSFEPETAAIELIASSLDEWAGKLLSNYAKLTGFPVAHAWQSVHGPIPIGRRLLPKTPFILGGKFDEKNLFAVDAVKGMRYRGELWQQIRDLPDGAQVRLKVLPLQ